MGMNPPPRFLEPGVHVTYGQYLNKTSELITCPKSQSSRPIRVDFPASTWPITTIYRCCFRPALSFWYCCMTSPLLALGFGVLASSTWSCTGVSLPDAGDCDRGVRFSRPTSFGVRSKPLVMFRVLRPGVTTLMLGGSGSICNFGTSEHIHKLRVNASYEKQ